ncbi:MAG: M66 family metalloprotease [Nannocystaceae bacterium]
MVRSIRLASLLGLVVAVGCNGSTEDTDTDSTSATDSAATTGTGTDSGTSGTGTGGVDFQPIPARNITLDRVQANQAVGVDIAAGGAWVDGPDRTSYLLKDRLMLIRGFWKVDENWQPRKIQAILTITYADGSIHEDKQTLMIEKDAFEGDLQQTFYFGLMPEQVVPGMKFEMSLWETEPGYELTADPDPLPIAPLDGPGLVGVEDSDQALEVVIVPFHYNVGDCNTQPDTSEKTMKLFYDYMYMQDPVDRLTIHMHDPIEWDTKLDTFDQLNSFMSGMRFDEGAGPWVFYYGLVDACANGVGGAGGKAYGIPKIPPEEGQAYQRVSSGLSTSDIEWSAETFVHEVGHSLGRKHIDCGGAAGFDPTYPYPGGQVGEWGFGVIDYSLRHPTVNKDYMTYCHPTWVSNWAWSKVYPVIKTLTQWSNDAGAAPYDEDVYGGSLLVGTVAPDGTSTWITVPGSLSEDELSATDTVELMVGDEVVASQRAKAELLPGGDSKQIVIELPENFDAVTSFRHLGSDAEAATFAVDEVSLHHMSRAIRAK